MIGTLGVIQCRMGSSRLPGKALLPLAGQPVLVWVIKRLAACKRLDKLVLATTTLPADRSVADLAAGLGLAVVRGSENDVLARYLTVMEQHPCQRVVRITGDNPLTDPDMLDRTVDLLIRDRLDCAWPAAAPYGAGVDVFRASLLTRAADLSQAPRHREHLVTFFLDNHLFFRLGALLLPPALSRPDVRLTLDTPLDFERLAAIFPLLDNPLSAWLAEVIAAHDRLPEHLRASAPISLARAAAPGQTKEGN